MASVSTAANGRRVIQFVAGDGLRKSVRLGKISKRAADSVRVYVEDLVNASITKTPCASDTARWLSEIDDVLHARLAAVGLVTARASASGVQLGPFLQGYVEARADTKPATRLVYGHTKRCLIGFLGASKQLRDITPGDADDFRLWLINHEKLAPNTVRRRCGIARQFMRAAVRKGLVKSNPFDGLAVTVQGNPSRMRFVTREEIDRVIEACPDAQWRLIVALARYGGLRAPSEIVALRWQDVDWERGRIRITSVKTAHHEGRGERLIPMFPELVPHLREVFELAEPGSERVITRYRRQYQNIGMQFGRIVRKAGLTPWPKLFQNLRATRQTELQEDFPIQAVCAWMGNSRPVAIGHYLQVTDEHFSRAVRGDGAVIDGMKALQNPVQSAHGSERKPAHAPGGAQRETAFFASLRNMSSNVAIKKDKRMGPAGLEPATQRL